MNAIRGNGLQWRILVVVCCVLIALGLFVGLRYWYSGHQDIHWDQFSQEAVKTAVAERGTVVVCVYGRSQVASGILFDVIEKNVGIRRYVNFYDVAAFRIDFTDAPSLPSFLEKIPGYVEYSGGLQTYPEVPLLMVYRDGNLTQPTILRSPGISADQVLKALQ